jgi:uncharacterized protein YwqG
MRTLFWPLIVAAILAGLMLLTVARREIARGEAAGRDATPADVDTLLAPYQAALDASRRPAAWISLQAMADDDVAVSKVGGRPYWESGRAFPLGRDGRPLFLLAQINFGELPPLEGYPRQGLLQFFIADNDLYGADFDRGAEPATPGEQVDFRLVYWPEVVAERGLDATVPARSDRLPHDPTAPRRMHFALGDEPLSITDHRFDALFGGNAFAAVEAYAAQHGINADALFEALARRFDGSGHKLGGYPHFTQADPRGDGRLELLFQLDSDDAMMWGDVGVGGFFIAPDALARGDFSQVLYNWDCH